ncbi:hypothetical protein WN48_05735 [Eufriesea mexicana]|uniref:Uncharacterized protein n=1 Tax=Eufriesea mexicana TaxID=516756 RepID=A0A310S994_9HYME|nr:hypothetical protein WN48_05735 [Eufriesea mexicana]
MGLSTWPVCTNSFPFNQSLNKLSQNSGKPPLSFLITFFILMKASWYSYSNL